MLPEAADGTPYEVQLTADRGGGGPYTFAVTAGSLPAGLSLTSNGVLSGTPRDAAGFYSFSVTATNQYGARSTVPLQLILANAPLAVLGSPYSLDIPSVIPPSLGFLAGLGGQYVVSSGFLPPGLSLVVGSDFRASVSGIPAVPGNYTFSIQQVVAGGLYVATNTYTVVVDPPVFPGLPGVPVATVGSPYSVTLTGVGGSGTYFISLDGGTLPAGLTLASNGTLSGTIPATAAPGDYNFTVSFFDGSGQVANWPFILHVDPALNLTPAALPAATVASPYSQTLTATGGSGSGYTFALTGGALPAGLSLAANGTLSGTIPAGTLAVTASFTVTATDSAGGTVTQTYTLAVNRAITLSPGALPPAGANLPYSQTLTATGGSGSGYTFALTSGTLPTGLSLGANGTLSGTVAPTMSAGYYTFTVTATDSAGATGSVMYSLLVDAVMTVGPSALNAATVLTPYTQLFTATGGSGIYSFAVTGGSLPPGLSLGQGGKLTGTIPPTTPPGSFDFTVTATDTLGMVCDCLCSLDVNPASETWTGNASTAWSNPANWSAHVVPGAGVNVTIPGSSTNGRLPVLDAAASVNNLTIKSGASLTLAGHNLTTAGTLTNQGTVVLQGNEAIHLAGGNDTTEGTWKYVGDGSGATLTLPRLGGSLALPGAADYFNLTIADTHAHRDTFQTAASLAVNGNLSLTGGTLTASGGPVTTAGLALSGTGVLNAPATLSDSGNWTVSGGTFNPTGGTVFFTGAGTQLLNSGGKAFSNLSHTGTGTLGLAGNALMVNGAFTNAAGVFQGNGLGVTVAGPATLTGGTYQAGSAASHFNGGLTLNGGNFVGSTGSVTAAGVTLTAGMLIAPTTLSDSGDWNLSGGTFNANKGTVVLNGTNQHLSGSSTFYNLTKVAGAADTLTFQAGSTQTVTGNLTLRGNSGSLLALRSSVPGSVWDIDPLGLSMLSFLNVHDSVNLGKPILAARSVNSGHNTGWTFPRS
jgi:hypothetical protein